VFKLYDTQLPAASPLLTIEMVHQDRIMPC
jgi:hypothetical protein